MPAPTNALAPAPAQPQSNNKLLDFLIQHAPSSLFPTAGRVFLESMQGKRGPITEADFSPEELNNIRKLIGITEGRGNVQYKDYAKLKEQLMKGGDKNVILGPSVLAATNPLGNALSTLGRFTYARDSDGTLRAVDTYDFNSNNPASVTPSTPYAMLRQYGYEKMPPGTGRPVNINLGK